MPRLTTAVCGIVLLLCAEFSAQTQRCPPNETYRECGSACEPSCEKPTPQFCTAQCVEGCQCNDGFLRSRNGRCVLQKECSGQIQPSCAENETYRECGTACEPSCTDPNPQVCTMNCVVGCQCNPGFVRNELGQCVKRETCLDLDQGMICGRNEEFKKCGTLCEQKCGEDWSNRGACLPVCKPNVCQCKTGYVRNDITGQCVLSEECPVVEDCGANEIRVPCGTMCEPKCSDTDVPKICPLACKLNACECKKGYVRDENSRCILKSECPANDPKGKCGPNESFRTCSSCEGTCLVPVPFCTMQCRPPKCQCNAGYVRHGGRCVSSKSCRGPNRFSSRGVASVNPRE